MKDKALMAIIAVPYEGLGDGWDEALKEARRKFGDPLMEIEMQRKPEEAGRMAHVKDASPRKEADQEAQVTSPRYLVQSE